MPEVSTRYTPAPALPAIDRRRFPFRQRIVLRIIIWLGYGIIRLIGPTLRVSVSYEDGAQHRLDQRPLVASFWHSCMIPATYIFRDMGIRVMSSNSYDGEYMGRIIHKFGFVAVKGSSSRNAVRALLGLRRSLEDGWTVAFTLDGPRQRQALGRVRRHLIGKKATVLSGPVARRNIRGTHAQDALGSWIEEQEFAGLMGDDNAGGEVGHSTLIEALVKLLAGRGKSRDGNEQQPQHHLP